jgi:hypothetical protein
MGKSSINRMLRILRPDPIPEGEDRLAHALAVLAG